MTEKCVSKPWTKHEDDLLRQAVAALGENDNWKNVALYVPGRTNKACRKVRAVCCFPCTRTRTRLRLAVAPFALAERQEDVVDAGGRQTTGVSTCNAWDEMVLHCKAYPGQNGRCLLKEVSRGTGSNPQQGGVDCKRR